LSDRLPFVILDRKVIHVKKEPANTNPFVCSDTYHNSAVRLSQWDTLPLLRFNKYSQFLTTLPMASGHGYDRIVCGTQFSTLTQNVYCWELLDPSELGDDSEAGEIT